MKYDTKSPVLVLALLAFIACLDPAAGSGAPVQEDRPSGYLLPVAVPDSSALLPPPPLPGSAAFAADEEASRKALILAEGPRWLLAAEDANLSFPRVANVFSCAFGTPISEKETPRLYALMRRVLEDAGASTRSAKNLYRRPRPFLTNREPICTPAEEGPLAKSASYPSGHATAGWVWALILAELVPDRSNAILARGLAFGESRVVCNVHWQSDVEAGYIMGAAVVARLHADPSFMADLHAAKAEVLAARDRGLKPRNCADGAATPGAGNSSQRAPDR